MKRKEREMRKNVWKRFLAMALAAVVMFTSVDCTGLVVNAEGTTKTLGELVVDHNADKLATKAIAALKHPDLAHNNTVYDFTLPEGALKSAVDLDVSAQTITVGSYYDEGTGITWEPAGATVVFKDASVEAEEAGWDADDGLYRYTTDVQTAEVDYVRVLFVPSIEKDEAEQAEILNAVWYMYYGSDAALTYAEELGTDAAVIEDSVDYLSQAITVYKALIEDEETLNMLQQAEIALPEIDTDALSENINALKDFELGTISEAGFAAEDKILFWKEYAQGISDSVTQSEDAITYLAAEDGDLLKLADFLQEVGTTLDNEDALKLGNKISEDYFSAYNSYLDILAGLREDDCDVDALYAEKTSVVAGSTGGIELPSSRNIDFYDADAIKAGSKISVSELGGTVDVTAKDTVITVNVSAVVIENNNEKGIGPKAFNVTIEKGSTLAELKEKAAGTVGEKLAEMDAEGVYNLNAYSDVYAPTYYDCEIEAGGIETDGVTDKASISVKYSPKNYVVTYKEDGKADVTETVPYLSEITLPASEVTEQSYEYTLVEAPELDEKVRDEGAKYIIKGNVTFNRELAKTKAVYRVNDVVLEAYTELKGTAAEDILKHSAVDSDTIAVRKPDSSLISAAVEGKTTIVNVPSFEANSELTWVPNRIYVKNKGITVDTVNADEIVNGVATIEHPKRDSIEVEYVLEVASGEKADEYVNLAYDLVQSVNQHIADMDKLAEYQEDLKDLNGGIFDMLSKANALAEYTDVKEALANIANNGCEPAANGPLIVSNYITDYLACTSDAERVQFYFDNYYCEEAGKEYTGLRAQIELLADNLEVITKEENKPAMDALIEMLPQFADKVGMLDDYAGRIGELRDERFEPMHKNILADSENYNNLIETLLSSSVSEIANVTSLCMTEKLAISGDDLPAAAKEQTVNVKVEWTKNGEVLSEEGTVIFYDVDTTEDVVALMNAKAEELEAGLAVDKVHYECTEPTVTENPENGSTVTYKWTAKEYSVEFVNEAGASVGEKQTFTYENPVITLAYPDTEHVYTYVIGENEEQVITENGKVTRSFSDSEFKALFDDANTTSIKITRKETDRQYDDAFITVNVAIEGSDGNSETVASNTVLFKVNGLGAEGVEKVKAAAAALADSAVDTAHYTCTEPADNELNENITGNTTVTYTWKPNQYHVELWTEGAANYYSTQTFYYDNPVISLDKPSKGYVHTFDINGAVTVKYEEGKGSEEYTFSEDTFKALFDDKGLETIKIYKTVAEQVINVTVQVKWNGNTASNTFTYGKYTEEEIKDLAAQMADDLGVDKVHYTCTAPTLGPKPEDDVTLVYEWKLKEYTVNLEGETNATYKTQTITYADPTFYLVYPTDEALVYHYTVLGNTYDLEYTGDEVFEFYLGENLFDEFFAGTDSVTISRTETEKKVTVTVKVEVVNGTGTATLKSRTEELSIPVSELGDEGKQLVKNTADRLAATGQFVDTLHYTCTEPELGDELTADATLVYKWAPNEYTAEFVDEDGQSYDTQSFKYDNRTIELKRPDSEAIRYYYNIASARVEVNYLEGNAPQKYNVSEALMKELYDDEGTLKATVTREKVNAIVEDNREAVSKLEDNLELVYGMVGAEDHVDLLQYYQNKEEDTDETNGNPEIMVIRVTDNEGKDGGIASAIGGTLGGLVLNYPYVDLVTEDEEGNRTSHVVVTKDGNGEKTISLQEAINAFLDSGIGTESIDGMFDDGTYKTENNVEIPDDVISAEETVSTFSLFSGRTAEKLGAEILSLDVVFGDSKEEALTLQFIFSFIDENVTENNKKVRESIKSLRTFAEVTGKDGKLTVDVKEPYSKEVFETYLVLMLLEGETDFANINDIKLTDIVEYEHERFITDLQGQGITVQTLENTMAKVGIDYDLNANPTIEKVITKLLDAVENDGYKDSTTSALKFYMDEAANGTNQDAEATFFHAETKTEKVLAAASAMGIDAKTMELITPMIIEEEMNVIDGVKGSGYLVIPVKVTVSGIDDDNAAMIINDPNALKNITGANAESAKIAANAIELVEADYFEGTLLNPVKVPNNSMVILLDDMEDTTIRFAGNGILDLNGHKVKEVVGKDGGSTVVLVDSTYDNGGSAAAGNNVKDARQTGEFYTVSEDTNGNLTVALEGGALAEAAEAGTTELKVLAVEIAFDLIMNNITSGDMIITGAKEYDIYDVDIVDDVFALLEDSKTDIINDVIDIVNLGEVDADPKNVETEGLFGFVNDVLAALTKVDETTNAFETLAGTVKDGNNDTIVSYEVATNPVKVNFAVAGDGDGYITAGIKTENVKATAAPVKTFTIDFKVADNADEHKLADLSAELADVVEKSNMNVDLDNIEFADKDITATGASVNAELHVNLLRGTAKTKTAGQTEAKGNHDYAAIIAMIAACGSNSALSKELKAGVEAYLANGSIDTLRAAVENITVKQLISAVKNANGKTFAEIAAEMKLEGNTDSVKKLAAVYDDLFCVVYRVATIVSNKLGIEGDNSKLGSLLKKETVKVGNVTFTYYSYGGDYEGERVISKGLFAGIGAEAEGSVYADLLLTLFAEDDYVPNDDDDDDNQGGSGSGSGDSSDDDGPVEVHPAPAAPSASTGTVTGDANNMTLWIAVMGIAIIAVVTVVAMKKKRTK